MECPVTSEILVAIHRLCDRPCTTWHTACGVTDRPFAMPA